MVGSVVKWKVIKRALVTLKRWIYCEDIIDPFPWISWMWGWIILFYDFHEDYCWCLYHVYSYSMPWSGVSLYSVMGSFLHSFNPCIFEVLATIQQLIVCDFNHLLWLCHFGRKLRWSQHVWFVHCTHLIFAVCLTLFQWFFTLSWFNSSHI